MPTNSYFFLSLKFEIGLSMVKQTRSAIDVQETSVVQYFTSLYFVDDHHDITMYESQALFNYNESTLNIMWKALLI